MKWSLRLERVESTRLAWALAISLILHGMILGSYYTEKKFGWWEKVHLPAWLQRVKLLAEQLTKKPEPPPLVPQEAPLLFVDVNPAVATPEPPKETLYYSSRNSRAANPEADKETDVPKIDGKQTEVVKTEDVPREKFVPLQPTPTPTPPAPPAPEPVAEAKAKPAEKPGDLTMAKPEPDPQPKRDDGQEPKPRARTIKEALARREPNRLPSQKSQQEGGVKHRLEIASLDAKATPFGTYDEALVEAISQCWFNLLDQQNYAADYRGKVVLQFRLHQDGRVSDVREAENTAGTVPGVICQAAVDKPNPYPPFPSDMRRTVGETRSIQFTFFYN
jgi:hypothetical protein